MKLRGCLAPYAVVAAMIVAASVQGSAAPIRYTGFVIADVTIGEHHFANAQVYITFDADTSTVVPFTDGTSNGYINTVGEANVRVISGNRVITARFARRQIFVYYDVANSSIGFGSYAGGRGYPLTVTAHEDPQGLTENSTVGAVSDIIRIPADAVNYTAETATLATNLTNPTALSGAASSCAAFDPATSICSNFAVPGLQTSAGRFFLSEPYTDDESGTGTQTFSINWGMFWSSNISRRKKR